METNQYGNVMIKLPENVFDALLLSYNLHANTLNSPSSFNISPDGRYRGYMNDEKQKYYRTTPLESGSIIFYKETHKHVYKCLLCDDTL